jgi:hypothetical protein
MKNQKPPNWFLRLVDIPEPAAVDNLTLASSMRRIVDASRAPLICRVMLERAAAVGTAAYIYATIFGLLHSAAYDFWTGINPLVLYDVQDFLMAGAKRPFAMLVPLLVIPFILLTGLLSSAASTLILFMSRPLMRRVSSTQIANFFILIMQSFFVRIYFFVAYGFMFFLFPLYLVFIPVANLPLSEELACSVETTITFKKQDGDADKNGRATIERRIVDSTNKFLFLRDSKTGRYEVIATDEVLSMAPTVANAPARPSLLCFFFK